ncbi:MAG: IS5 family transposase [Lachnospiraceae bacterium]|nr:IS5 family transposase [Lachnospiraceae bacterium]
MYKSSDKSQSSFLDFNQPMGLHMNPDNRWIKMADSIPWEVFEKKYKRLFKVKTGNVAKPLRTALGALIIQTKFQYSDRELVEQITENPYLQYFIGLPGYQEEPPFDASTLVLFRKRINAQMIAEANEYILSDQNKKEDDDTPKPPIGGGTSSDTLSDGEPDNEGTLILDATCAPVNIRYPQDVSLLNEAREKLETIIYRFHKSYGLELPRRYAKRARKDYLAFAKCRKHTAKKIRKTLRQQLSYVKRNIGYLEKFMADGYAPKAGEIPLLLTIFRLYEQQQYMYDNRVHSVENRIVSIMQPWIRPIVRGKLNSAVEFGAKLDISIDSDGYARIEKTSFDAYNESAGLKNAVERFKERTGHYPERVLADQIYRTRENRSFCKEKGIRLSGPKLGRPNPTTAKTDKKEEYQDNTDRIAVEREFSREKRCYGMGRMVTKLEETQLTSIALSVFVANLFKIQQRILYALFYPYKIFKIKTVWLSLCWT